MFRDPVTIPGPGLNLAEPVIVDCSQLGAEFTFLFTKQNKQAFLSLSAGAMGGGEEGAGTKYSFP